MHISRNSRKTGSMNRFLPPLSIGAILAASPAAAHDSVYPHAHFEWAILAIILVTAAMLIVRKYRKQSRAQARSVDQQQPKSKDQR